MLVSIAMDISIFLSQLPLCKSKAKMANYMALRWFLMTMATVVKVTQPKHFSCYEGPKAHLHAKFHWVRAVNTGDKIMSQVFDGIYNV